MPWRLVAILLVTGLLPCLAVAQLISSNHVAPMLAGLPTGVGGTMVGSPVRAAAGGVLVMGLVGLRTVWPEIDMRLLALSFAVAAGWETARTGGRALPMTLMAAGILWTGLGDDIPRQSALGLYAAGLIWGLAASLWLGLARFPKLPAEGDLAGLRQALFLAAGLMISITAIQHWPAPHAIWIVQMFVLRATAPTRLTAHQALRFAAGAMAGVLLALIIERSGLSADPVGHAIATAALIAGLRLLPLGPPLATIPMTLAMLLALAPTPAEAVFRSEAAPAAAMLAIILSLGLDRLLIRHGPDQ